MTDDLIIEKTIKKMKLKVFFKIEILHKEGPKN